MSLARGFGRSTTVDPVTLSRLSSLELKARLIVEGYLTGLHRSPYHGFSVEFAEHRAYQPGENPRTIDWRVYGRTERLFSKRYEEETNLRAHLIMDVSDSMRYPRPETGSAITKLSYAVHLGAAIAYLLLRQRDAVGLTLFDSEVRGTLPTRAQGGWLRAILQSLETELAQADVFRRRTATPEVLHALIPTLGRRGLVVILSDFLPDASASDGGIERLARSLQHIRHGGHEVVLIQLLDTQTEVHFELPNRPLRLRDLETGDELRLHPGQAREAYTQAMASYMARLKAICREQQVDRLEIDIRTPFDVSLGAYLRQRAARVR
jgi:uncharacterized protein (DUF58 family)